MKAVIVHLDPLVVPRATPARAVAGRMERDGELAQASVLAQLAALRREGHVRHVRALWIANAVAVTADDERHRRAARASRMCAPIEADSELPIRLADAGTPEPGIGASSAPELWATESTAPGSPWRRSTPASISRTRSSRAAIAAAATAGSTPTASTREPVDLHGHGTQVMGVIVAGNGIGHGARRALHRGARLQRRGREHRQRRPPRVPVAARSRRQPGDRRRARRRQCVVGRTARNLRPRVRARPPGLARGAHPAGLRRRERRSRARRPTPRPAISRKRSPSARTADATTIAPFSSVGPSRCDGGQFPSLVAAGTGIRSTDRFGFDATGLAGTSFAAPHVAGALALLLQVAPQLAAGDQASLLTQSAHDLGTPGPDATFGAGSLDVAAAARLLSPTLDFNPAEALGRRVRRFPAAHPRR